ncbi:uncharacterized protein LOC144100415 [Amblyomma americanum]
MMMLAALYISGVAFVACRATNDKGENEESAGAPGDTAAAAPAEEEILGEKLCSAWVGAAKKCANQTKRKGTAPEMYKAMEDRHFMVMIMQCFKESTSPQDMTHACESPESLAIMALCTKTTLFENSPRVSRTAVMKFSDALSECISTVVKKPFPYG